MDPGAVKASAGTLGAGVPGRAEIGAVEAGAGDMGAGAPDSLGTASDEPGDNEPEPETGPLRRCVVTRERLPKERMIRFVVGPDHQLVPDLAARLPGRGIWLSASADVLESHGAQDDKKQKERRGDGLADRRLARAFSRAAHGPVSVPADLPSMLQAALVRRITELLGLARRAGQAVAGFEKAREYLRNSPSRLVLQAADGSVAERARFLTGAAPDLVVIDPLPGEALGRVFGRDYVVHVAVAPGKLAESLVNEAGRLAGLRQRSARAMGSERATGRATVAVNKVMGANG